MSQTKDDGDVLIQNPEESPITGKSSLSFKWKIIIIISVLVIVIIIGVILFAVLKGDSDDDIKVLDPIVIEPVSEYTHCIIWLHGLDNCPENFQDLFKVEVPFAKKNNTKIILMRAPYQVMSFNQQKQTSWFDIFSFPINNSQCYNFTDATRSKKMVEKIINQEAKKLNGKYQNIYVGGHSQGACISLYTAYNFDKLLGGVLACSGVLFEQVQINGDKKKLNVFLAHGENDQAIPFEFHKKTVERIKDYEGVKTYYYPKHGHDITGYEKVDMGGFLNDTMID